MPNSTLIKSNDDITVIGLIMNGGMDDYRNEIELLVKWRNDGNLILNVDKELIVNFRKCRHLKDSIIINGSANK